MKERVMRARRAVPLRTLLFMVIVLLAACQPGDSATPEASEGVQAKLLATVYISRTPDAAQQQATRAALLPTLTAPAPTALPSATVYVGTFLEPADSGEEEAPMLDATQVFAMIPGLATERPSRCQIPTDERFGDAWRSESVAAQTMACPIEAAVDFTGTVQVFETGVMYYTPNGPVWAIETTDDGFTNHQWTITQTLPPVEGDSGIAPPPGLKIPSLGFGAVWFGVDGVRQALGFARTDEQQALLTYQRFEGGTLFLDRSSGIVYILLADGTAYGPY